MVLLSHGRHFLTPVWEGAADFRIGGFLGVELFFVLSGFLIGSIAWQGFQQADPGHSWIGSFLLRRWLGICDIKFGIFVQKGIGEPQLFFQSIDIGCCATHINTNNIWSTRKIW